MNEALPEKPIALSIDVEQWRRDIQTFADTTKRALDAIAGELSNGCTGKAIQSAQTSNGAFEPSAILASGMGTGDLAVPDRLARLKSQLAKRISSSNQSTKDNPAHASGKP
jgi:hypothetical protein